MKRALITGITGQDGSFLAELLLTKGYGVYGLVRRSSSPNINRIAHILGQLQIIEGDLGDGGSLTRVVRQVRPAEIYNLGAQSHVRVSFDEPEHTGDVTGQGVWRLLEAVRHSGTDARFYQASSSEMFGDTTPPQSEVTPFNPCSPYAVAKVVAYHAVRLYRRAYGLHASNGILFNHESDRRGAEFVTRKITLAAAAIKVGRQDKLRLGNLDAKRDWGFAGDYVAAMHLMLQQEEPDDYVIATGEMHTVREFVEAAFSHLDLDWRDHVEVDPALYRPADVTALCGDTSKAKRVLGWKPAMKFNDLVRMMVESDLARTRRE